MVKMGYKREQSRMPLYESINEYLQRSKIKLHMPGHKGLEEEIEISWQRDLSEVPGLDNYHQPGSSLKEAQELLSELYQTEKSFFLVNGASSGIIITLMSHAAPGNKVLLPRHSHRSLFNAMVIAGVEPVYLPAEISPELGLPLGVSQDYIRENKEDLEEAELCIVQNPTYAGIAEDVYFIENMFSGDMVLAADEAHGGHFFFHDLFPPSALEARFHLTVHGAHKTLGSLTQTGFLHACEGADLTRLQDSLAVTQSTSPSYLFLASMDAVRYKLAKTGRSVLEKVVEKANNIRRGIDEIPGLYCLEASHLPTGRKFDITRLVLLTRELGLSGFQFEKLLFEEYGIQMEMSGNDYVVGILAVGDTELDEKYLLDSLQDLALRYGQKEKKERKQASSEHYKFFSQIPETAVLPREAFFAPKCRIDFADSVGKVAGETISPYPPGIPVVCAGEMITYEILQHIQGLAAEGAVIHGSSDPELKSINVITK